MTSLIRFFSLLLLCSAVSLVGCGGDGGGGKTDAGSEGGVNLMDAMDDPDGALMCTTGDVCTVAGQCGQGNECEQASLWNPAAFNSFGGSEDPILNHPVDEDTEYASLPFPDGYCTPNRPKEQDDPNACTQVGCGGCGICVPAFDVLLGEEIGFVFCAQECDPTNGSADCTNGNICAALQGGGGVCVPGGCQSDDECRVGREDTNENNRLDPYNADFNPSGDRLRYFTDEDITGFSAECDDTDRVCTHSGTPGAEAGDACVNDFQCEANGACFSGLCASFCDTNNPCAGDGECLDGVCFQQCNVGDHVGDNPLAKHTQCDVGGACYRDADADAPFNGICLGGNFNGVASNNVGTPCLEEDACYSPYGYGICSILRKSGSDYFAEGFCSVSQCADADIGAAVCGAGAKCVSTSATSSVCAKTCTTGADCQDGQACADFGGATGKVCVVGGCTTNADCKSGTCDVAAGYCVDDCATPADCGAGQACVQYSQAGAKACLNFCFDDDECKGGETCVLGEGKSYGTCAALP